MTILTYFIISRILLEKFNYFLARCIPPDEAPPPCPDSCSYSKDNDPDIWCLKSGDLPFHL